MYRYDFTITLSESDSKKTLAHVDVKGRYIDDIRALTELIVLHPYTKVVPLKHPKKGTSVQVEPPAIAPVYPTKKDLKELSKK